MTGTARSEVFARIRHASGASGTARVVEELQALGSAPSAALPCQDLGTAFLVNVLNNMGTVDCAIDRSGAVAAVGATGKRVPDARVGRANSMLSFVGEIVV